MCSDVSATFNLQGRARIDPSHKKKFLRNVFTALWSARDAAKDKPASLSLGNTLNQIASPLLSESDNMGFFVIFLQRKLGKILKLVPDLLLFQPNWSHRTKHETANFLVQLHGPAGMEMPAQKRKYRKMQVSPCTLCFSFAQHD